MLKITYDEGEYWLHIKGAKNQAGINLGNDHDQIVTAALKEAVKNKGGVICDDCRRLRERYVYPVE